jgi:hypothetical protein
MLGRAVAASFSILVTVNPLRRRSDFLAELLLQSGGRARTNADDATELKLSVR